MGDVIEGAFPKKVELVKNPEYHTQYDMLPPSSPAELDVRVIIAILMDKGVFSKDEFIIKLNELWN